jgi:hypothetical protein
MTANVIWIIAEVLSFITPKFEQWTVLALAFLFLISAFVLFSAYRHIPKSQEYDKNLLFVSFRFLLLGNFVWILAESSEMIIGATAELIEYEIGRTNSYIRILISIISICLFFTGIYKIWNLVPKINDVEQKD